MHTRSDNIEIMIGDDNDDIIEELFKSFLKNYEENLQNKMRGSDFEFDGVNFLYYDFNKISLNREDLPSQNLESFFKKYEEKNINTFYKDFGKRYDIDTYEINNDIKDYNDKIIAKYHFSQKYNAFINEFNKFERIQEKKRCHRC